MQFTSRTRGRALSDMAWAEIGRQWATGMGFEAHVVVLHGHDHIHIVASRINVDRSVVHDGYDYLRGERIVRSIERDFGLIQVHPSQLLAREGAFMQPARVKRIDLEMIVKMQPIPRLQIATLVDTALADNPTLSDFIGCLGSSGVGVRLYTRSGQFDGISFSLGEHHFSGSSLGSAYSYGRLLKRGLKHEPIPKAKAVNETRLHAFPLPKESDPTGGQSHRIDGGAARTHKRP
ncbi:relaxase/mobilization nuclease domain-containing protein [Nitrospirillum amazonense]|uniref:relaxase/mobilization nuclease domain-containing protein n=1 Tax=Nitrospirillum amazonense TaxID=28077 RepID=UPI003BAF394F